MTGPQTHRSPRFEHALLRTISLTAAAVAVLSFSPLGARAATGVSGCSALSGVQVRNTTITAAQYVTSPEGNYCEVSATVAPQHDMRVRLPDGWERRYVQLGGGGFDGSLSNLSNGFGTVGKDPVAHGFVVAGSNGGHRGTDFPGASFAADRGLTLSYSVAKIYDTDLVATALMQAYYGEQPAYRYFTGCSNGGKNASVAAANFFGHYDGIVGAAGVWGHNDDNVGGADMPGLTAKWIQTAQVGALSPAKGAALYGNVVQACDGLDGVKDGIVANVQACPVRHIAQSLRCKGADDGSCLTDADLAKVAAHTSNLILDGRATGPAWSPTLNLATMAGSAIGLSTGFLQMAFRSATPIDPLTVDLPTQFLEIKTVLDDVAETHDPAELAALDDGEVTNAVAGHAGHDRPDAFPWRTRNSRRGHQLGNRQCQEFRAVLGKTADDVALRDQPKHGGPVLAHHLGTDALDLLNECTLERSSPLDSVVRLELLLKFGANELIFVDVSLRGSWLSTLSFSSQSSRCSAS